MLGTQAPLTSSLRKTSHSRRPIPRLCGLPCPRYTLPSHQKNLLFCLIAVRKSHGTGSVGCRPRAVPLPPGTHPSLSPPGTQRPTCPSAIFGSRLGKEEVLAQGFLSLAAGAEEVTQPGRTEGFPSSHWSQRCACAEWKVGHLYIVQSGHRFELALGGHVCAGRDITWIPRRLQRDKAVQSRRPYFGGSACLQSDVRCVERHCSPQVTTVAEHVVAIRGRASVLADSPALR